MIKFTDLQKTLVKDKNQKVTMLSIPFGILFIWYLSDLLSTSIVFSFLFFLSIYNLILIKKLRLGLIPIFTYFFVAGPGYTEYLLYYISDGELYVALFASNPYITEKMLQEYAMASLFGGVSVLTGFSLGKAYNIKITKTELSKITRKVLIYVCFALFAITTIVFTLSQGQNIFLTGSYGEALQEKPLSTSIGVFNVIMIYTFFTTFLLIHKPTLDSKLSPVKKVFIIVCGALILFLASRGVRQDPFGMLITLILVYKVYNNTNRVLLISTAVFILAWLFTVISGEFRYDLDLVKSLQFWNYLLKINSYGNMYLNLDTASSIVGTFHFSYLQVNEHSDLLLGKSYLDWIPRTLPAFIYPDRPENLAWSMVYGGEYFSLGGVQNIAEAYWNFGRLGVVFISLLFAYIISSLSLTFLRENVLFSAIPLLWLATLPRWSWYQSFSLYKGFITILILIFCLSTLHKIFRKFG